MNVDSLKFLFPIAQKEVDLALLVRFLRECDHMFDRCSGRQLRTVWDRSAVGADGQVVAHRLQHNNGIKTSQNYYKQ